jgi:hypothetical protein
MFENLAPETRLSYSRKVDYAVKISGAKDFDAMIRSDAAYSKLRNYYKSDNTLKATLTAVLAGIREKSKTHASLPKWRTRHAEVSRAASKAKTGVLTKEVEKKYVCWCEIESAAKKAMKKHSTIQESMDAVLLSLVTMIPPKRSDYGDVTVVARDAGGKNRVIVPKSGAATLVLTEFKTSKSHGEHREVLPTQLGSVIRKSLAEWPRKKLFVDSSGAAMSPGAFGAYVKEAMTRHVGKPVGVTMLRHIYISDVVVHMSDVSKTETAKKMLHSVKEQKEYLITRSGGAPVCGIKPGKRK